MPTDAESDASAVLPADAVVQVRTAALIGAAGLTTYLGFVTATRHVFLFSLVDVAPLFAALILLHLVLAATAEWWSGRRRALFIAMAFQAMAVMFILHRLGGVMMGALLVTGAFPIIMAEMFGISVFGIANVLTASYAVMVWEESSQLQEVRIGIDQQLAFAVMAFLVFNWLAIYTHRYSHQLGRLAENLRRKVTERTRELTTVNQQLAANARALQAKQEEFRDFVYAVTHDLKGPVNAILLTADLLAQRDRSGLDAESREELDRIVRLAAATEDMIRDLLDLFRITSLPEDPEWVELTKVTEAAVETLRPKLLAKHARVEVNGLPRVWGQPSKLARVVANLLDNAVKYVPPGRGHIEIGGGLENGHVVVTVRDNGIGIPEPYRHSIFDLFVRVPADEQRVEGEAVPGSGVGLNVVKRIVETHGGTVSVDSAARAGTCFTVRLPAGPRP